MTLDTNQLINPYLKTYEYTRESMILDHLYLVKYIVERLSIYLPPSIDKEDLIEAGIVGLIDAVDRYNPKKNCKFSTYAKFRIKGAIFDEIRSLDILPKSLRQKSKVIEKTYSQLEDKLGRLPSDREMAKALGIEEDEYRHLLYELRSAFIISFEDLKIPSLKTNDYIDTFEFLLASNQPGPIENTLFKELSEILSQEIDELPERTKLIITLYYYEEMTITEIAKILNLAKSTVSEIHTKALIKLRSRLRKKLNNPRL